MTTDHLGLFPGDDINRNPKAADPNELSLACLQGLGAPEADGAVYLFWRMSCVAKSQVEALIGFD